MKNVKKIIYSDLSPYYITKMIIKKISLLILFSFLIVSCSSLNSEKNEGFWNNTLKKLNNAVVSNDPTSTLTDDLVGEAETKASTLTEDVIDNYISNSKTEISITGMSKGKPQFDILNVTGFGSSNDDFIQNFIQSSVISKGDRETINIGLGRRYLTQDEKFIYGLNSFFDYDPNYGHQRASVGAEVKSSALEFNLNSYQGLSGWRSGKNNNQEKALDGYDLELGSQLPFLPSTKIYLKKFKWDLYDAKDLEGYTYSLKINDPIKNGLSLEVGQKDFDGSKKDESFAKVTYVIPFGGNEAETSNTKFISDRMFENESMKKNMLDKVRRNNAIVTQTKFTSSVGGV